MATEYAIPLTQWLEENGDDRVGKDFTAAATWGLYSLISALSFFTQEAKCIHGCLSTDSVFVTRGGDYKLAGFELAGDGSGSGGDVPDRHLTDADAGGGPCPDTHKSPERLAREWSMVRSATRWTLDAYSLGVVVWEVWGGARWPIRSSGDVKAAAAALGGGDGSGGAGAAASLLTPAWKCMIRKLLSTSPTARPEIGDLLTSCDAFRTPLVGALLFLEELALKEPKDKSRFFSSLPSLLPRFPTAIAKYRLLPALLNALEYGAAGGGGTVVLGPILEIGGRLSPEEYSSQITPVVIKLFASLDRATRLQLLTLLPAFLDKCPDDVVNSHIITSCASGFNDTSYPLREATVKAALVLAPRANPASMRNLIIPNLKKCLTDLEPGIRVNATICLGRISGCVEKGVLREGELLPCFLREMRDPFPHARAASLRAVIHSIALEDGKYWDAETVAKRIMPAAAHLALDTFGEARSAAYSLLEVGLKRLKEEGERLGALEAKTAAAAASGISEGGSGSGGSTPVATAPSSNGTSGYGGIVFSALGWAMGSNSTPSSSVTSGSIGDIVVNSSATSSSSSSSSLPSTTSAPKSPKIAGSTTDSSVRNKFSEQRDDDSSSTRTSPEEGWDEEGWGEADTKKQQPRLAKVGPSLGKKKQATTAAERRALAAEDDEEGGETFPKQKPASASEVLEKNGWGTVDEALDGWASAVKDKNTKSKIVDSHETTTSSSTVSKSAVGKSSVMPLKGASSRVVKPGGESKFLTGGEGWGEW